MTHGYKHVWMVVEDDSIMRSILGAMMVLWEVEPLIFSNGFEAMEWLDAVERGEAQPPLPDIALVDIRMPGPPGYEIGARMRHLPATRAIPLILMSAYRMGDADRDFIQKTANPEHLLEKPLPPPDTLRELIEQTIATSARKKDTQPVNWSQIQAEIEAHRRSQQSSASNG